MIVGQKIDVEYVIKIHFKDALKDCLAFYIVPGITMLYFKSIGQDV